MGKSWKCRIGWHAHVRRAGHDDPNHQICVRCHKTRGNSLFGAGGASLG